MAPAPLSLKTRRGGGGGAGGVAYKDRARPPPPLASHPSINPSQSPGQGWGWIQWLGLGGSLSGCCSGPALALMLGAQWRQLLLGATLRCAPVQYLSGPYHRYGRGPRATEGMCGRKMSFLQSKQLDLGVPSTAQCSADCLLSTRSGPPGIPPALQTTHGHTPHQTHRTWYCGSAGAPQVDEPTHRHIGSRREKTKPRDRGGGGAVGTLDIHPSSTLCPALGMAHTVQHLRRHGRRGS